jgi:hypothetical protein
MNSFSTISTSSSAPKASFSQMHHSIPPTLSGPYDINMGLPQKSKSRKNKANNADGSNFTSDSASQPKRKKKKTDSTSLNSTNLSNSFNDPWLTGLTSPSRRGSSSSLDAFSSSSKRPRGRPPLAVAPPKKSSSSSSSSSSFLSHSGSNNNLYGSFGGDNCDFSSSNMPSGSTAPNNSSTSNNNSEGGTTVKIPRPSYKFVVGKVLSKLMVSDPISSSDLMKILADCPKDMIHSVLEISQVLGIVIQSKSKEGLKQDYPAGTIVYSLVNYVKGSNAVSLDKLEEDIKNRIENEKRSALRMKELQVALFFFCCVGLF